MNGGNIVKEINVRFKKLRKTCKKTQTDFGKILGISSSGIANIETGQRSVTEKHLIMLSNWEEYHVNIDWLRTGEGEMFLPDETDILEAIRKEYHLTDAQFKFVSNFLRLPESEKNILFNFLQSVFEDQDSIEDRIQKELESCPDSPEELEKLYPPVDPDTKAKLG